MHHQRPRQKVWKLFGSVFIALSCLSASAWALQDDSFIYDPGGLNQLAVRNNPWEKRFSTPRTKAMLPIRIINHGLKGYEENLREMIKKAEVVFSQCGDLDVSIPVVATESSKLKMKDRTFEGIKNGLIEGWFVEMLLEWPRGDAVIDVHLVDHLSPEARREYKKTGWTGRQYLGKAFPGYMMAGFYKVGDREITGAEWLQMSDVLFLAMDTFKAGNGRLSGKSDRPGQPQSKWVMKWKEMKGTLLAHELGHLLLEKYSPKEYRDHYCPAIGADCERDNIMSSGGSEEIVYLDPNSKSEKVIGYSLVPKVDEVQCANFLSSPYLRIQE